MIWEGVRDGASYGGCNERCGKGGCEKVGWFRLRKG